ncbi:hypothetical protein JHK82_055329 [Glycine max]|nr:hypothetical protein JHK86_055169 [Glycine max]KAG4917864.1 hypothetical protein JHK85_056145 [Glycine max]KAG5073959.1 hypothetical protein JHK84_055190 [Glycine max]KAG5076634.1 hypothetical protein JHK82_055329 [Glycine max]
MSTKQGGKAKPLKKPKSDKKDYDEVDMANIQKNKEEEKVRYCIALKELKAKAQHKGSFGGFGLKKSFDVAISMKLWHLQAFTQTFRESKPEDSVHLSDGNKNFEILFCVSRFPLEEAGTKGVELCSLWQENMKNSAWHPFKVVTVDDKAEVDNGLTGIALGYCSW